MSRIAEIMAPRRTAHNLLDTYVGHGTGGRVLSGAIRRGDGDAIQAVIWFCCQATPIHSGVLRTPLPTARIAMVDARDIAAAPARCLLDEAHVGQRYCLTGPEAVSFADVAACQSEASGRAVRHEPDTLEEARAFLERSSVGHLATALGKGRTTHSEIWYAA